MSGSLVSSYFAERLLPDLVRGEPGGEGCDHARALLCRWHRSNSASLGPVSGARAVFDLAAAPIAGILGYRVGAPGAAAHGSLVAAALAAAREGGETPAPSDGDLPVLLATAWGEDLDSTWREAVRLGAAAGASWCLCVNGTEVRLVDTGRSHSRRHLSFEIGALLDHAGAFAVLWALCRPGAFARPRCAAQGAPPLIDRVALASARETVAVCRGLRTGVLEALRLLLGALSRPAPRARRPGRAPGLDAPALLEQSLTIVYRVLFLLFAESRELLPTWHPVYREGYSMEAVRSLAERDGPAKGLWETLQAISRLSHSGCRAGNLTVTPFNGRLFAPALTPAGERSSVDDETARQVVLALGTAGRGAGPRARVAYRDLGVEQLGSVYEAVLDYRPVVEGNPAEAQPGTACPGPGAVRLVAGAGVRKATGTFYTPQSITTFLVRQTLEPLVSEASPEEVLDLRVVDPAMGSGAFLVAACHFLAGAYEAALLRDARCRPGDVSEGDRRSFRRTIASRCLFGVDLNPMAVQLARLSLWLTTLAPDRPLTFLDHRLVTGDSLVGASLDDIARRPAPAAPGRQRRGEAPLLRLIEADGPGPALRAVLPARARLAGSCDDTLAAVREKEKLLASVSGQSSPLAPWKRIADAWCALGLGARPPGLGSAVPAGLLAELADSLTTGRSALPDTLAARWLECIGAAAADGRFFHWTLEFPEVFFAADGSPREDAGFDAVLGNPPWDMLREDNPGRETRGGCRPLARFARRSGLYHALGDGHANSFQLFVERSLRLVRRVPRRGPGGAPVARGAGGRLGLVLPWGLASDAGCGTLRRVLFDSCALDPLLCFDNSAGIFPIHRSVRFTLLTASAGGRTEELRCRIGLRDPASLDAPGEGGAPSLTLTRSLLRRVSGDDLAIPDLRSPGDLALLEKLAAAAPPFSSAAGWGLEFGRELNATDDRRHFTTGSRGCPVLEGKHLQPFRADVSRATLRLAEAVAGRLYSRTGALHRSRLAYREVASASNRLTLIAAVVPAGAATVHTVFCARRALASRDQWFLCGILNSFVANFLVRLRVTTHVTAGILARLPVPRPADDSPAFELVARLARELSASPEPEADARYPLLQGWVARLYGFTQDELAHVLATFPLIEEGIKVRTMASFLEPG